MLNLRSNVDGNGDENVPGLETKICAIVTTLR